MIASKHLCALAGIVFLFLPATAWADSCIGTPKDAIMELPPPLNKWGRIICTPYGHVIASRERWIWTPPGTYSPVFIPSQMVRDNPERVGNASYFSKIDMRRTSGDEYEEAYKAFHSAFAPDKIKPDSYRLDLTSVSKRKLAFFFFDYGTSAWGIWCTTKCDPTSVFMLLDMDHRPETPPK